MSEAAEKLKPLLDALTNEERIEVLTYLADHVDANGDGELADGEWDAAWIEEINRRVEAIRNGTAKMIPGDEVMQRLREKFG